MGAFPGPGSAGEYKESVVTSANLIALSTGTAKTVTSLSLAPGEWDVTGVVDFNFDTATSYTAAFAGVSQTDNTLGGQDSYTCHVTAANVPTGANDMAFKAPVTRLHLATTTTVYLVAKGVFSVSFLKVYGTLRARRVR